MRGPDMGGGVGGMLYSLRGGTTKYSLSNGRGDIVAQADQSATLTWTASYEAYGKRTKETGTNQDKQRANSKDEDPTGLLNEGFRYRDIETGVWLSRDPAGFVDGPNLYAYVKQNPWTAFDTHGLYLMGLDEKPLDARTIQILKNVRDTDKRLAQIITELAQSPYGFEISAHLSSEAGEKGEFSPRIYGNGWTDATGRDTRDRYNGKGMGGRIYAIKETADDGKTPEETMAHELGHAFDCNRGISPLDPKKGKLTDKTLFPHKLADIDENENNAVRTENIYNEAKGKDIRTKYPIVNGNGRTNEGVPNPEGKNAPVSTAPKELAPHLRTESSAKTTHEENKK